METMTFDYAMADSTETFDAFPSENVLYTSDMQSLINTFIQNYDFILFPIIRTENKKA
jgi:hypothetical protein